MKLQNPILPGFHPDPSIIRVGSDYYLANSTFEWFPGVQINHSADLVNWEIHSYALTEKEQLDMTGVPDSGGIHAPCLSHDNGTFYLVYTIVKSVNSLFRDHLNFVVTTTDLSAGWSAPRYLNSMGFDPSIFHDDDGKRYLTQMVWNPLRDGTPFAGISLQELDAVTLECVGDVDIIFEGSSWGITEGSHIFKKNGYYYLMTAEGGTGLHHCVTVCRSRNIRGPYEIDPKHPVLSAWHYPKNPLAKSGHGDLVETPEGELYMVHLCSRSSSLHGKSPLGRETAIQKMQWTNDGWIRLASGNNEPELCVDAPASFSGKQNATPVHRENFNGTISHHFQTLRIPRDEHFISLKEKPGVLRIRGRETPASLHCQSLIARRQTSFSYTATTAMDFSPDNYLQLAGLICYYSTTKYHYLCVTTHDTRPVITIVSCIDGNLVYPVESGIEIDPSQTVYMQARMRNHILKFSWSYDAESWTEFNTELDATILSDEFGSGWGFTGAMVGLTVQDMQYQKNFADFHFFEYRDETPS